MTESPGRFAALFGASAVFWWYFEYLNLVVGNWHYLGVEAFSDLEFILFATLAFSTVLPAVLSTRALLATFPVMHAAFVGLPRVGVRRPRILAGLVLGGGVLALFAVGLEPRWLFAMVWIAPLLVLEPLRVLWGEAPLLDGMGEGDWRALAHPALAALACGLFWEMWNHWSLARWTYTVPYVDSLHVFEMPLLGYAGYLPFGVECAALGALVMGGGGPRQARPHRASTLSTLC